ncbi:MAG: hypothetical protein GY805_33855 [Chloroflexi bacterium]|nr:hypothetical protein [Chloroflexota bacterium]
MPIPNATIEVDNLPIAEDGLLAADENGRIILHQLERGIMYIGQGSSPPTFRFAAPNYESRHFSVDGLAALSGLILTATIAYQPPNISTNLTIAMSWQFTNLPFHSPALRQIAPQLLR